MAFRLRRLTLGSKYALGHLLLGTLLLVASSSELVLMVVGFPLLYLPWLASELTGYRPTPPALFGVLLFALLWVGNSYLWGYLAAGVHRLVARG